MVRNFYFLAFLLFISALVSNCKSDLKTEEIPAEVPKDKYLVTIPDGGSTYPILSFQNGTNTLYADA